MGKDSDPITLHKYLYANGDGVNHVDPSGQMSLGSMVPSISMSIILGSAAISTYNTGKFLLKKSDADLGLNSLNLSAGI